MSEELSAMSRFVENASFSLQAWYEGRYGEKMKANTKLETKIIDKFVTDLPGWIHMFHGIDDNRIMDEREEHINNFGMQERLKKVTEKLRANLKEVTYDG